MTSDGGQPPKPKDGGAQNTLIGFPQQPKDSPPAAEPAKRPASIPPRHPLPPPRGRRESTAAPPLPERARRDSGGPLGNAPPASHGTIAGGPPISAPLAAPSPTSAPLAPADSARAPGNEPSGAPASQPPRGANPARAGSPAAPNPLTTARGPAPAPVAPAASGPTSVPQMLAGAPSAPVSGPTGIPQPLPNTGLAPSGPSGIPQPLSGPVTAPSADPHMMVTAPVAAPTSDDAKTGGTQPQFSGPLVAPAGPAGVPPVYTPSAAGPNYYSGPTAAPEPAASASLSQADGSRDWGGVVVDAVAGSKFVNFLRISAKRAFRLRIESEEVLPAERDALERATPPIADRNLQAFLAWRRSVLFLVAVALIPLTLTALIDVISVRMPTPIRVVKVAPLIAEIVFLAICWNQLRHWAHWRRQRRWLLLGWLLFMATPFVVFIYPLSSFSADALRAFDMEAAKSALVPFTLAMLAMLQLAPKAISLMPGLIRASLVIKLLFPGSSGPGWLIAVAAPLYALLAYVILIVPYQFTGSAWYVLGIVGIVIAQSVLARAGFALAQPHTEEEAVLLIKKVRTTYVGVMVVSGIMIIIALSSLVRMLNLHVLDVVQSVLKFETNVLILTLIGSDLVITNLERARQKTIGRDHVEDEAEAKIAAFVSLDAPHVPPPRGPAPLDFDQD